MSPGPGSAGRDPYLVAFSANVRDRWLPRLRAIDLTPEQRILVVGALAESVIEEIEAHDGD